MVRLSSTPSSMRESFPASKSIPAQRTSPVIRKRKSPKDWTDCATGSTEYFQMGARFAKWRAVIALSHGIPSRACIEANAQALARYAAVCQEAGTRSRRRTRGADGRRAYLGPVRSRSRRKSCERSSLSFTHKGVMLEGMILKPNMVLPGSACPRQEDVDEVADATVKCLLRAVPAAVPGVAFLSGGQSAELASARLNDMNVRFKSRMPWALAFSFARAIQQPALEIWRGDEANVPAAQQALLHRARCNRAARRGEYNAAMEKPSERMSHVAKPLKTHEQITRVTKGLLPASPTITSSCS